MKSNQCSIFQFMIWFCLVTLFLVGCSGQDRGRGSETQTSPATQDFPNTGIPNTFIQNLISEVVRTIYQDKDGVFWFGTQNGAFRLANDSLVLIDGIKAENGKQVTIKSIVEAADGTMWFGHTDGISSVKDGEVKNYDESDGLLSNDVWSLETEANGNLWIGTIKGVCLFDGKAFKHFKLPEGKVDPKLGISSTTMVNAIHSDQNGNLWFISTAGLFSYTSGKRINKSKDLGIEANFVHGLFEDSKGRFWVTSEDGLYLLEDGRTVNITSGKIEMDKGIGVIAEDNTGTIWFVCNQHDLYTYDGKELHKFQKSADNPGPVIFEILEDKEKRLWFVGYGGAFRLEEGQFVSVTKNGPW